MKNCKNCFWYDKCEDRCDDDIEVDCDYYEPLDDEEIAIEEYEKDLKERAQAYQELIDKQNG